MKYANCLFGVFLYLYLFLYNWSKNGTTKEILCIAGNFKGSYFWEFWDLLGLKNSFSIFCQMSKTTWGMVAITIAIQHPLSYSLASPVIHACTCNLETFLLAFYGWMLTGNNNPNLDS